MQNLAKALFSLLLLVLCVSGCKKHPSDEKAATMKHMVGDWNCSVRNYLHGGYYNAATNTSVGIDSTFFFNEIARIDVVDDTILKITCKGYDIYLDYIDIGQSFNKSTVETSDDFVYFPSTGHTNSTTGGGLSTVLIYYPKQDSIVYYHTETGGTSITVSGIRKQ